VSGAILVLNAGSSSIKFSLFPGHEQPIRQDLICEGEFEAIGRRVHFAAKDGKGGVLIDGHLLEGETHEDALAFLLRWVERTFPQAKLPGKARL
jgi:acetate kinase